MQVSEKVERLLDSYGKVLSPDGLAFVQRLFAEAKWKAGHQIGDPEGVRLLIRTETRPLTPEEEELIRERLH